MSDSRMEVAALMLGGAALVVSATALLTARRQSAHRVIKGMTAKPVYSAAQAHGGVLYVSGQVGLRDGKIVDGGVPAQTKQALLNLKTVLESGGSSLDKVIKTTCYLADMADYSAFNAAYLDFFPNSEVLPARVCVAVKGLPLGASVEVDCIARL